MRWKKPVLSKKFSARDDYRMYIIRLSYHQSLPGCRQAVSQEQGVFCKENGSDFPVQMQNIPGAFLLIFLKNDKTVTDINLIRQK